MLRRSIFQLVQSSSSCSAIRLTQAQQQILCRLFSTAEPAKPEAAAQPAAAAAPKKEKAKKEKTEKKAAETKEVEEKKEETKETTSYRKKGKEEEESPITKYARSLIPNWRDMDAELQKIAGKKGGMKMIQSTFMNGPTEGYRLKHYPELYTASNQVSLQKEKDLGRYYHISDAMMKELPECIQKHLHEELDSTGNFLMVRQPGLQLAQRLISSFSSNSKQSVADIRGRIAYLYGQRGCGKSATLHYLAQLAKEQKWLLIALRCEEFAWTHKGVIVPSDNGIFDMPQLTQSVLGRLLKENEEAFRKVYLRRGYDHYNRHYSTEAKTTRQEELQARLTRKDDEPEVVSSFARTAPLSLENTISNAPAPLSAEKAQSMSQAEKEAFEKERFQSIYKLVEQRRVAEQEKQASLPCGSTLYDLLTLVASDSEVAPIALRDLVWELRFQQDIPALILLDNVNQWDQATLYQEPKTYKRIMPRRLALVDAFQEFQYEAPVNGATVYAFTSVATARHQAFHVKASKRLEKVEVKKYSDEELKNALCHYHVSKIMLTPIDHYWVYKVKALSGAVPKDVATQAWLL